MKHDELYAEETKKPKWTKKDSFIFTLSVYVAGHTSPQPCAMIGFSMEGVTKERHATFLMLFPSALNSCSMALAFMITAPFYINHYLR